MTLILDEPRTMRDDRQTTPERAGSRIAYLSAASRRLSAATTRDEALSVIEDIVVSLVGCKAMAVFELDAARTNLVLARAVGIDAARWGRLLLTPDVDGVTACIPVKQGDRVVGAIVVFDLVPRKRSLDGIDYELFDLIGHCAGRALASPRSGTGR